MKMLIKRIALAILTAVVGIFVIGMIVPENYQMSTL